MDTAEFEKGGILGYVTEPVRNEIVSVGATSVQLCEQRLQQNKRKVLLVRNTSIAANQIITVNLGANPAVAGAGIVLNQNESFTDSTSEGYEAFQGSIQAICAVAGGQVTIMER